MALMSREVAHSFTPAKDEVVGCGKQLVEGEFVSSLVVKRRNTRIVLAKLPIRQVACQQPIVSRYSEFGEQSVLVTPSA